MRVETRIQVQDRGEMSSARRVPQAQHCVDCYIVCARYFSRSVRVGRTKITRSANDIHVTSTRSTRLHVTARYIFLLGFLFAISRPRKEPINQYHVAPTYVPTCCYVLPEDLGLLFPFRFRLPVPRSHKRHMIENS